MSRNTTKKIEITDEMVDDVQVMSYADFCVKWNVSLKICKKISKEYGVQTFYAKNGNRPHRFIDGVEYKWCGKGHWETLDRFGKLESRWDGLRWACLEHDREERQNFLNSLSPERMKSRIRRQNVARRNNYVKWTPLDEQYIYDVFGGHCAYCRCPVDWNSVEFDHFVPIKHGGKTHPSNMLPTCIRCNRGVGGKASKMPEKWLVKYFGQTLGMEIYLRCSSILSDLK